MDDIVNRLRTVIATPHGVDIWTTTALEAADEIERLRQHAKALAEGLRQWDLFADEYLPSLMARPGATALRNWKEYNERTHGENVR